MVLTDLDGTEIEVFTTGRFIDAKPVIRIRRFKLGHVAFIVDNPVATAAFCGRVLGFRVSEWIEQFFVFMHCGADHHTVNFLKAKGRRMHQLRR